MMAKKEAGMRSPKTKKAVAKKAAAKKKAPTKKKAAPQTAKKVAAKGKNITKEIAEEYLKDASSVDLRTFTAMDDAAAVVLSKSDGWLNLNGLTHLSNSAAKALARFEGGPLSLNGVTELSDEAACLLSERLVKKLPHFSDRLNSECGRLQLCGMKTMQDSTAKLLASCKCGLELGVTALSDASAEHFASFGHTLKLPKLSRLSDAAAKSLETLDCEGRLEVSERFCKTMSCLATLCPEWTGLLRFAGWTLVEKKIKWKDVPEDVSHVLHRALNSGIDASKVKLTKITLSPSDAKSNAEEYFVGVFDDRSEDFSAAYVVNANEVIAEYEN